MPAAQQDTISALACIKSVHWQIMHAQRRSPLGVQQYNPAKVSLWCAARQALCPRLHLATCSNQTAKPSQCMHSAKPQHTTPLSNPMYQSGTTKTVPHGHSTANMCYGHGASYSVCSHKTPLHLLMAPHKQLAAKACNTNTIKVSASVLSNTWHPHRTCSLTTATITVRPA